MKPKLITFMLGLSFSLLANASDWKKINDVQLNSAVMPKGWQCKPMDSLSTALSMKTCGLTGTIKVRDIPVSKLEAGYYLKHGNKVGMIYVGFPADTTPKFGRLLETELGKPTRMSKVTPQSVTLTWELKGYMVALQRDDKRDSGTVTVTADWVYND